MAEVSRWLPGWDLEEVLGRGRAGVVFRGRQRSLDRAVTVKVLHARFAGNRRFRKGFEREARATAGLRHPNLVQVHDFGEAEGHLYLVAEYVHGKSLERSLRAGKVEAELAVEIMLGVCRGLAYLHEHGVVHGDLKPSNILLTPKLEAKIGDFGLAMGGDDEDEDVDYHAPEQEKHRAHGDEPCDVFAAGVILGEMLTGERGTTGLRSGKVRALRDRRLREVILKASHPSPARRHPSAQALLEDLEGWSSGKPAKAVGRLATDTGQAKTPRKPVGSSPEEQRAARSAIERESARFGRRLAVIVLLLLVIVGMVMLLKNKQRRVEEEERELREEAQKNPFLR